MSQGGDPYIEEENESEISSDEDVHKSDVTNKNKELEYLVLGDIKHVEKPYMMRTGAYMSLAEFFTGNKNVFPGLEEIKQSVSGHIMVSY